MRNSFEMLKFSDGYILFAQNVACQLFWRVHYTNLPREFAIELKPLLHCAKVEIECGHDAVTFSGDHRHVAIPVVVLEELMMHPARMPYMPQDDETFEAYLVRKSNEDALRAPRKIYDDEKENKVNWYAQ